MSEYEKLNATQKQPTEDILLWFLYTVYDICSNEKDVI